MSRMEGVPVRALRVLVAGGGATAAAVVRAVAERAHLVGVVGSEAGGGAVTSLTAEWGVPSVNVRPPASAPGREVEQIVAATRPDLVLTVDHPVCLRGLATMALAGGARAVVNLHPGFLPTWRGPEAIARAIAAGEQRLGVAAHLVDRDVWTGDLIEVAGYPLDELEDRAVAEARAQDLMVMLADRLLERAASVPLRGRPQPATDLWFPDRPLPRRGRIDWTRSAHEVADLVRALTHPGPGCHTVLRGARLAVRRAVVADEPWHDGVPGEVVEVGGDHAVVSTGAGMVAVLDLEPERPLDLRVGDVLGSGS